MKSEQGYCEKIILCNRQKELAKGLLHWEWGQHHRDDLVGTGKGKATLKNVFPVQPRVAKMVAICWAQRLIFFEVGVGVGGFIPIKRSAIFTFY